MTEKGKIEKLKKLNNLIKEKDRNSLDKFRLVERYEALGKEIIGDIAKNTDLFLRRDKSNETLLEQFYKLVEERDPVLMYKLEKLHKGDVIISRDGTERIVLDVDGDTLKLRVLTNRGEKEEERDKQDFIASCFLLKTVKQKKQSKEQNNKISMLASLSRIKKPSENKKEEKSKRGLLKWFDFDGKGKTEDKPTKEKKPEKEKPGEETIKTEIIKSSKKMTEKDKILEKLQREVDAVMAKVEEVKKEKDSLKKYVKFGACHLELSKIGTKTKKVDIPFAKKIDSKFSEVGSLQYKAEEDLKKHLKEKEGWTDKDIYVKFNKFLVDLEWETPNLFLKKDKIQKEVDEVMKKVNALENEKNVSLRAVILSECEDELKRIAKKAEKVDKEFAKQIRERKEDINALRRIQKAGESIKNLDYDGAIKTLKKVLSKDEENSLAWLYLAMAEVGKRIPCDVVPPDRTDWLLKDYKTCKGVTLLSEVQQKLKESQQKLSAYDELLDILRKAKKSKLSEGHQALKTYLNGLYYLSKKGDSSHFETAERARLPEGWEPFLKFYRASIVVVGVAAIETTATTIPMIESINIDEKKYPIFLSRVYALRALAYRMAAKKATRVRAKRKYLEDGDFYATRAIELNNTFYGGYWERGWCEWERHVLYCKNLFPEGSSSHGLSGAARERQKKREKDSKWKRRRKMSDEWLQKSKNDSFAAEKLYDKYQTKSLKNEIDRAIQLTEKAAKAERKFWEETYRLERLDQKRKKEFAFGALKNLKGKCPSCKGKLIINEGSYIVSCKKCSKVIDSYAKRAKKPMRRKKK